MYPSLPIIISSRYGEGTIPASPKQDEKIVFLGKPSGDQLEGTLALLDDTAK